LFGFPKNSKTNNSVLWNLTGDDSDRDYDEEISKVGKKKTEVDVTSESENETELPSTSKVALQKMYQKMVKKAKLDIREKMDLINLDEEEEEQYKSKSNAKWTPAKKARSSYIPKGRKEV